MSDASKTDQQLLREFIERRSDAAFAEIVRRHFDWIHSVARRQASAEAADDLTQAVFLVLLQKVHAAARRPVLSVWLFGVLRYAVLRWRRDRQRQRKHEQHAAEIRQAGFMSEAEAEILPVLDELLADLGGKDRQAILVRFYEQRTLAETGRTLGISEEAARKRLERAIEKLQGAFAKRGITSPPAILSGILLKHVVTPAPPNAASMAAKLASLKTNHMAIQLSKGAMRMMSVRQAGLAAVSSLGICLVLGGSLAAFALSKAPEKIVASNTAPMQQVNFVSSGHDFIAISRDGQVSGYSNMLGKWTPLQLPSEAAAEVKRGHLDGMIVEPDVAVLAIQGGVYGFSPALGKWTALPLDADAEAIIAGGEKLIPVVSTNIAAIKIGDRVYGYSPMTGAWDALGVDIDTSLNALETMQDMAVVNYGDHLAIFSVNTGKWAKVVWAK